MSVKDPTRKPDWRDYLRREGVLAGTIAMLRRTDHTDVTAARRAAKAEGWSLLVTPRGNGYIDLNFERLPVQPVGGGR